MIEVDHLLIGGGVAAYSAACAIRQHDAAARVLLVCRDSRWGYDLPALSKDYLKGLKDEAQITYPSLQEQGLAAIDVRLEASISELDARAGVARIVGGDQVSFRNVLIATGSSPIIPPLPGVDLAGVHVLRTATDAAHLAAAARGARRAVVLGAGFVGLEVAGSLREMGLEVIVVEQAGRVWPRMPDARIAARIAQACRDADIELRLGKSVAAFHGAGAVAAAETCSGDALPCDLVCLGVGARPALRLAKAAGLAVDDGLVVDDHMRTGVAGVYAAGDIVAYRDPFTGRRRRTEHWGHAEASGRVAGLAMSGAPTPYAHLSSVWSHVLGKRFDAVGDLEAADEVRQADDPALGDTASLFLRDGRLIGLTTLNAQPRALAAWKRKVREASALDLAPATA